MKPTEQNKMQPVYVIDGMRTPFLKTTGGPNPFSAADLGVQAGRALLMRQPFHADALDEVILGCVSPAADEVNIARVVALRLGCAVRTPAWTVQRNCGSGMQALDTAVRRIGRGEAALILAGGVEAMSRAPLQFNSRYSRWMGQLVRSRTPLAKLRTLLGWRPGFMAPVITLLKGLTDPTTGLSMGQTAENLAYRFGIERESMDAYAVRSHQRAAAAWEEGRMAAEVTPLYDAQGQIYAQDDGIRPDSQEEKLAKLKPAFEPPHGRITAGNSAQITDGAALLLLASEAMVEHYQLTPLGKLYPAQWVGLAPEQMGLGPAHAIAPLLQELEWDMSAIDLWEINEAFAAQVMACSEALADGDYCAQMLGVDHALGHMNPARLNVDGGAVSLGHPVGASGARIVLHLLHALGQRHLKRGIAALCIGGGQGGAMLVEGMGGPS
ncbi:3-ketoacyl-CoA thiolase [Magnetococcus marinus MC-1]|uniref:3-ketoacyl-CoA thiolase n=1 Tax=Magnetococcus marinus (strain ATCC BAA-1437 / JCM 17883 / MC-1) TaxID=156889 RepID=A0LDJ9_MAGMM|nr:acetyl-CoA C-acetyltransferase [Magnetococcus marinus]ABK46042.1 3-ketoacyl-CoA thiolase [Magnetococcus marinus MC-1]